MKNLAELNKLRDKMRPSIHLREERTGNIRVVVGMGTCGIAAGARSVLSALVEETNRLSLDNVTVVQSGCPGMCKFEPVVEISAPGCEKVTYVKLDADKARRIANEHLNGGNVVAELTVGAAEKA